MDAERIAGELETAGTRTVVAAAYDGFLVLNPELLDLCTAWQLRSVDGVVTLNDHSDPGYDARVLDRLTDLDRRAEAVCADLSAAMLRFRRYRVRLTDALASARSGALDDVTDSTASYHAVVPAARGPARHPRHPAMTWIHPLAAETEESADVLGGKAHGLVVLLRLGLPVPPGFVIGTGACRAFLADGRLPDGLDVELAAAVAELEAATGRPPAVSVRSGGRVDARHDDHHPQPPGPAGGAGGRGGALVMGHAAGPDLP